MQSARQGAAGGPGARSAEAGEVHTVLRDDINNALKEAMKAKDERRGLDAAPGQFRHQERRYRGARRRQAGRSPTPSCSASSRR